MDPIINEMIKKYENQNVTNKTNIIKEVMQEIILSGLARAGFFNKAAFYGETALRIFYGLDRFSEDLDFSLKTSDKDFNLSSYLPILEKEVNSYGLNFKIEEKIKTFDSNIKSAFLNGNTIEHLLIFYSDNNLIKGVNKNELIKIKFEIDIDPPLYASYETRYQIRPTPYEIVLYDLPSLFAGKIAAILCRAYKHRVKGRDLYDYIFYLQINVKVNLKHLKARLIEASYIKEDTIFNIDKVKEMLNERFDKIDYEDAKNDVIPFINNPKNLDVWSANFFKTITKNLEEN